LPGLKTKPPISFELRDFLLLKDFGKKETGGRASSLRHQEEENGKL
jgi:hypothetical protein